MRPDGWAEFVGANPKVQVVCINFWHNGDDPAPKLAAAGLGSQSNLRLLTHPNPSGTAADRVNMFLGLPITRIPSPGSFAMENFGWPSITVKFGFPSCSRWSMTRPTSGNIELSRWRK